jgi:flavin-binding protein dodecin
MAVARVTQIIGASPHSWEDDVRNALERANKTLRGITGIEVVKENAAVEDGRVAEYRATVLVTFVLEGT